LEGRNTKISNLKSEIQKSPIGSQKQQSLEVQKYPNEKKNHNPQLQMEFQIVNRPGKVKYIKKMEK
jgi:hypothetical protein